MAANNTPNFSCPTWLLSAGKDATFAMFYIVIPICFIISIAVYPACVKAFYIESRKEKSYLYQVYLTVCRMLMHVFIMVYGVQSYWLSPSDSVLSSWFRSCYPCMWFAVKVPAVMMGTSSIAIALLSIQVAADRLYALWKPHSYRASNGIRGGGLIALLLVSVAVCSNAFYYFRQDITPVVNTTFYVRSVNNQFMETLTGVIMVNARTVVDTVGLVLLCVSNVALVLLYRVRRLEAKKKLNKTSEMKKRETVERTLFLLALVQCISCTVNTTYRAVITIMASFFPRAWLCQIDIHAALILGDALVMDIADFVCMFTVCKPFRNMIMRRIFPWNGQNTTRVSVVRH